MRARIPASLHFQSPNPHIPFDTLPPSPRGAPSTSTASPMDGWSAAFVAGVAGMAALSRGASVFVILMFITILIYGMWVATGVATEKSSRVMELMISAASPRQLLFGKVVGIGGGHGLAARRAPAGRRPAPPGG